MSKPARLVPDEYYHIYSRGNNRADLFLEDRNYRYFLELYTKHVAPIADTFAYCLLRNHFHVLLRFRGQGVMEGEGPGGRSAGYEASRSLSNLFNSYAKGFNRAYGRSGALFQRPFGRVRVASQGQLMWLVVYIHRNPERHGLVGDFRVWRYSSYRALVSDRPTGLAREAVVGWFGGREALEAAHGEELGHGRLRGLVLEEG